MKITSLLSFCALSLIIFISCKKDSVSQVATVVASSPSNSTVVGMNTVDSVSWSANVSADIVKSYNIYAGTSATTLILIGNTTSLYYKHTGLINGTTYFYAITALNSVGESIKSTIINTTPQLPLNSTVSLNFSATLPGALKAAPYRYYDKNDVYYGNPYVGTDTFKYHVKGRVIDQFDTALIDRFISNKNSLPSDVKVLNDFNLSTQPPYNNSWRYAKTVSRIEEWAKGISGEYITSIYGPDTIPVFFHFNASLLNSKNVGDIISSIRIRVESSEWGGGSSSYKPYSDITYKSTDFVVINTLSAWDKKTPTIYAVGNDWLFILPLYGNRHGSLGSIGLADEGMGINVTFKDNTTIGRYFF